MMRGLATQAAARSPGWSMPPSRLLQRKCACGGTPGPDGECAECRKKRLQRGAAGSATNESGAVPPIVHEVLRSPGQPLDEQTRAFMEPRFDHDFSRVRVHTDARAAESARTVGALAYTVGSHVVFGAGAYAPGTHRGRVVLAHELAHVFQQGRASGDVDATGTDGPVGEREANAAALAAASGQRVHLRRCASAGSLHKIDLTADYLDESDIDPQVAVSSPDFVDNGIDDAGLREEWSGLSVRFIGFTIKYMDGSILDIPIDPVYLQSPNTGGKLQIIRYRRHTPTGKIVPLTWRGTPDELTGTPGVPEGRILFAKDVTPNIMAAYDDAIVRRAFAFAGDMAAIWGAALGARALAQMFSATQVAAVTAAGRGALGGGYAAARAAAVREAERQALEAEKRALLAQLKTAGVKFTEKEVVQVIRSAAGKIVWLEKGNAKAGLEHIMTRHGSQFSKLGVTGEEKVSRLIMDTLHTKAPVRTVKDGQVFKVLMGGTEREMNIVVGNNGFIVTAYPL
jgi:hypothetical protein